MSGLFSRPQAVSAPAITGVSLQTSVAGRCIPVIYGTMRLAPNLLYYTDFVASPHQQGGKGGAIGGAAGKGGAGTTYTYSASVILGMSEGPVEGFGQAWASKTPTTPAALGLTAFIGAYPQSPWGYVVTAHPADSRPYSGIAYLAGAPYQFGNSGQIPNNNFEVYGAFSKRTTYQTGTIPGSGARTITVGQSVWADGSVHSLWLGDLGLVADSNGVAFSRTTGVPSAGRYAVAAGVYTFAAADGGKVVTIGFSGQGQDADPSQIVTDFLTNVHYGVGFPQARVGELSAISETHLIPSGVAGIAPATNLQPVTPAPLNPVIVRNPQVPTPEGAPQIRMRPDLVIYPLPDPPVLVRLNRAPGTNGRGGHQWAGGGQGAPTVQQVPRNEQDQQFAGSGPLISAATFPTLPTEAPNASSAPAGTAAIAVSVNSPGTFLDNLSVADASTGVLFTCVAGAPAALQYSFAGGNYVFNAADSGKSVLISYVSRSGLATLQNYCWAAGIFLSPAYDNQQQASAVLDELAAYTNSEVVFSSGSLKVVPRGDTALAASGHIYSPPSTVFDLTDDHFKNQGGTADPVVVTRKRQSDQINVVQLQFRDRSASYNPESIEATDQAMVDAYGRRTSGGKQAGLVADQTVGRFVAQLMLQEQAIRKTYGFSLSQAFSWLDPMDLVTITDTAVESGALKAVRILDMSEADDGSWDFTAEDYLAGIAHAPAFQVNTGSGFAANYNADPGSIGTPVIFEPPVQIATNTGLEAWIYFSGSGALFGGGEVWAASEDSLGNVGDYQPLGRRDGESRVGVLLTALAAGADPDVINTVVVDISQSAGGGATPALNPGTNTDADQGHTLCLVDSELIAFSSATLIGANQYLLGGYIRRGMYGTAIASHAPGARFARLDDTTFVYPYDKSQIGRRIHLKIRAYNLYGGGLQDLSAATDYPYSIIGPPSPLTVQGFVVLQVGQNVVLEWTDLLDVSVKGYDIRYGLQSDPGGFGTATQLTLASRTTETTTAAVGPGVWRFYIAARNIADQLGPITTFDVTISPLSQLFQASGTWIKPNGLTPTSLVLVELWGGGGGGGSSATQGGGGGGAYVSGFFLAAQLGATETVTIAAGGTSPAGPSAGGVGGHTLFGLWLTAFGGGGGTNALAPDGGGGGGALSDGLTGGAGGGPLGGALGNPGGDSTDGGGGGGVNSGHGGNSTRGGGGGGGGAGGTSIFGGGGGGGWDGSTGWAGGTSQVGGDGGTGGNNTTPAQNGQQPSGGGGAAPQAIQGGVGGAGQCRVTAIP